MNQTLRDKTAVVTGSTSGIGLAIAEALLARGAHLMFNGIFLGANAEAERTAFQQKLAALRAQYPQQKLSLSEADITDPKAVDGMMHEAAALNGKNRIDVLVNNAGVQRQFSIQNLSVADFDLVLKTNLSGTFYNIKAALPYLKRGANEGFSQIVNISSVHGLVPSPERAAYCAAKHGDEALKGVAAAEFAPFFIRVTNVNPAFVKTELALKPLRDRAVRLADEEKIPPAQAYAKAEAWRLQNQQGKWIELEAVAKTVADLADFTDKRPTGESVLLDYGYVEKARREGAAYFDADAPEAVRSFNRRIAEET